MTTKELKEAFDSGSWKSNFMILEDLDFELECYQVAGRDFKNYRDMISKVDIVRDLAYDFPERYTEE